MKNERNRIPSKLRRGQRICDFAWAPCVKRALFLSYLELIKSKTSTSSDLSIVLECGASYNGPDGTRHWARGNLYGFFFASNTSALLASRLVEPGLDISLPVFVKMGIGNYIVSLGSHGGLVRGLPC